MTDPIRNGADFPNWSPFDNSFNSEGEVNEDQGMVDKYRGELEGDRAKLNELNNQLETQLSQSGLDENVARNFRQALGSASEAVGSAADAFDNAVDAHRSLASEVKKGLSRDDRDTLETLMSIPANSNLTPELQEAVDRLRASNPEVHARWQTFNQRNQQLAAAVLNSRQQLTVRKLDLSSLKGKSAAAQEIRQTIRSINSWVGEYNTDLSALQAWEAELTSDLEAWSSDLSEGATEAQANLRAAQRAHDAAQTAAAAAATRRQNVDTPSSNFAPEEKK